MGGFVAKIWKTHAAFVDIGLEQLRDLDTKIRK